MLIIGCDFHARFQQIALLNTETGELEERQLGHENWRGTGFLPTVTRTGPSRDREHQLHAVVWGDAERART
jgi:hypothetical protein